MHEDAAVWCQTIRLSRLLFCPETELMTLAELKANLASVEAAIMDVVKNGQSVNVTGSVAYTLADLDKLRSLAQEYRERIFRAQGYTLRTKPDFSS